MTAYGRSLRVPTAGQVTVTAIGADVASVGTDEVYLSFALMGHRNPPAVTAAIRAAAGESIVMWTKADGPGHVLLFTNAGSSTDLILQVRLVRPVTVSVVGAARGVCVA